MVNPCPVFPSPNSQLKVRLSPSASEVPTALNVADWSAFNVPDGSIDMLTVGGELSSNKSVQPEKIGATNTNMSKNARGRTCFIM